MKASNRVVIAGGSGFLGQSLAGHLMNSGYSVDILTRAPNGTMIGNAIGWNPPNVSDWAETLDGAVAVVNLAGRSVNCRYDDENRREIISSRVDSVNALASALRIVAIPPVAWIQAGSLAIYGNPGSAICDEHSAHGSGFSVRVCEQWEAAFDQGAPSQVRKVLLRIGIVLSQHGGALKTLVPLARLGLGGRAGDGRQYISWMHIDDFNRLVSTCIECPTMEGVYNATGPDPVTNAEFMTSLRRALHHPWSPPIPAWAIRAGAIAMRTEPELILEGRRCAPSRLLDQGFEFKASSLDSALRDSLVRTA